MSDKLPTNPKVHLGEQKTTTMERKSSSEAITKATKIISKVSEIKKRYENLSRSGETSENYSRVSLT